MQIFIWFLIKVSWLYTVVCVWVISVLEKSEKNKRRSKASSSIEELGGALQKYTDADFVQP